jgi:hypothetical protein
MSRLPPSVTPRAPQPGQRWRLAAGSGALAVLLLAGSVVINMQVAAEHDRVLQLKRQLVVHTARIRELQAETVLRSRTALVQGWNTEKLHLEAPRAQQYLQSPLLLASFAATPQPGAATPGFQLALARIAPAGAAAPATGTVAATAPAPAPAPAAPGLPQVVKAAWAPATPPLPAGEPR